MTQEAIVTGMGMLTSLGVGVDECWEKLKQGISGARPIKRFETEGLQHKVACHVDWPAIDGFAGVDRAFALLTEVIDQALEESKLVESDLNNAALVLAICPFDLNWEQRIDLLEKFDEPEDVFLDISGSQVDYSILMQASIGRLNELLKKKYKFGLPPISLHTACSSGNSAIQIGRELILDDETEIVIVAGCEISSSADAITRFGLLTTLDTQTEEKPTIPSPFSSDRGGFVLGEGAAALVMQKQGTLNSTPLAKVAGCGEAVDTYHRTRSDPEATAAIYSEKAALEDAGITADRIDYINAHGTGTHENDKTEANSILEVFGKRGKEIPISANKSMVGHTLSAAGVVEAIFSIRTLQTGICPPTINYNNPDPNIPLNVVPNKSQKHKVNTVLSNSFGFGGSECLVSFSRR